MVLPTSVANRMTCRRKRLPVAITAGCTSTKAVAASQPRLPRRAVKAAPEAVAAACVAMEGTRMKSMVEAVAEAVAEAAKGAKVRSDR